MTQISGLWTTDDTTPEGHQVASYTQAHASIMWEIAAACSGSEGVAPNYGNNLSCTTPGANQVDVNTGGAIVDGKWYKNDAVVALDIDDLPSPSGGTTRIDRIVVEATWANYECVITVIQGSESGGTPVAPDIPATSGTEYAIPLYQALIESDGTITLTNERQFAKVSVDDSTIEWPGSVGTLRVKDSGITTAKIADDAVTTAKIPNRTRKFLVPCIEVWDQTTDEAVQRESAVGYLLYLTSLSSGFGNFIVPQDFVSGLTVAPVWFGQSGSGNIYYKSDAWYGALEEDYDTHSTLGSYAALAVVSEEWQAGAALSLSSAAAGDIVSLRFYRDATNASDTYDSPLYFVGFLVSYTADS